MTTKITLEKIGQDEIRVTLIADIRITGSLMPSSVMDMQQIPVNAAAETLTGAAHGLELLTVEQAAEVLNVGRDKVYYLIRSGQLRSIKIGKLRRISTQWITEFIDGVETDRNPG
jgi:excisionase family DNA binding protein